MVTKLGWALFRNNSTVHIHLENRKITKVTRLLHVMATIHATTVQRMLQHTCMRLEVCMHAGNRLCLYRIPKPSPASHHLHAVSNLLFCTASNTKLGEGLGTGATLFRYFSKLHSKVLTINKMVV